jgi:Flp pilus assembly protein TadG
MNLRRQPRRAATTIELAMIAPAVFFVLLGLIVGGMGVFRYQQLAHLTREASRWAALHGTDYAKASGQPAATAADVYNTMILPNSGAMNASRLSYSVVWNTSNDPYRTATVDGKVVRINNIVTVSISYQWIPEVYLGGVTLSSSSSNPVTF